MRRIAIALSLALSVAALAGPGRAAVPECTPDTNDRHKNDALAQPTETLALESGNSYTGFWSAPETPPTALVAMMHGYGNDAGSWVCHLLAANEHGALAFALDYPGQDVETNRGWRVQEGATASIELIKHFLEAYPSIQTVVSFGVSMGGNASGLLVADAKNEQRKNGKPLVDYWFNVEGVTNLRETYLEAKAVGHTAAPDIEEATGGTLWEQPEAYSRLTLLDRVPDVIASGVKGVVSVHAVADGTVPYNQTPEFHAALRAQADGAVASEVYTVLRRGSGEPGSTGPGYVLGPLGQGEADPFAGHAWEGSETHIVMRTALERLWALLDRNEKVSGDRSFLVDGEEEPVPLP